MYGPVCVGVRAVGGSFFKQKERNDVQTDDALEDLQSFSKIWLEDMCQKRVLGDEL